MVNGQEKMTIIEEMVRKQSKKFQSSRAPGRDGSQRF